MAMAHGTISSSARMGLSIAASVIRSTVFPSGAWEIRRGPVGSVVFVQLLKSQSSD
jgi:hypothetical protein